MCGIAGILRTSGGIFEGEPRRLVERMLTKLQHRGPDDNGVWSSPDGSATLGHTRLSILDLSASAHQPMVGMKGSVLVYNGEIYNFQEMRERFQPDSLRSTSDTEVLLRCYETDGKQCLKYLNGMFAFALWDPGLGELVLARDRVEIKPLYDTMQRNVFAFASETAALLSLPWISAELDEQALSSFLSFNLRRQCTKGFPSCTLDIEW